MRKVILKCGLSPGDVVMLTAALRDLHYWYPGQYLTDVRTPCPGLWENNPHLTVLSEEAPDVKSIDCTYPLIDRCNEAPYHCLHGFIEFLNSQLGLQIKPTLFRGDIHLSEQEKAWYSQVHELSGVETPFWIIVAGGKYDVTIKWWDSARFQAVVDHFRGKIQFVQVGEFGHHHPKLNGVIDLRGQTGLRELVRLIYHAQGVLCPVTAVMHLAAAVESKPGYPVNRPCVVVAGGREPPHWEAYPQHQYIHTVGALPCCADGGCWRDRTRPLGDGDARDQPDNLCLRVSHDLPRCMDLITAHEVMGRIQWYYQGGILEYLTPAQARQSQAAVQATASNTFDDQPLNKHNAPGRCEAFLKTIPPFPDGFHDRGIVICAGGPTYFPCAWVCINMLRKWGCGLPIQVWHLGRELSQSMKRVLGSLGVECVDALAVRKADPVRRLRGWELKPYAILHSPFKEVLYLDADNVPIVNPQFLFSTPEFRQTGAVFWPDYGRLDRSRSIWVLCGVPYRDEPEFETGQILLDKEVCWRALCLTMWFNEHSDFFYAHIHGDKETFHMAFRKVDQPYAMPPVGVKSLAGTMCQHDFEGRRIFQHRNSAKWSLRAPNARVTGFQFEEECLEFLADLRSHMKGSQSLKDPVGSRARRRRAPDKAIEFLR